MGGVAGSCAHSWDLGVCPSAAVWKMAGSYCGDRAAFGIDFIKSRRAASARAFAWDQAAHVLTLAGISLLAVPLGWSIPFAGLGWPWIVGLAGFVAVVLGVGCFVGAVAEELINANSKLAETIKAGLKDGGKQIGRLERALIFAFIMVGEPTGIGFLVAAKSILRFEESKQQPVADTC